MMLAKCAYAPKGPLSRRRSPVRIRSELPRNTRSGLPLAFFFWIPLLRGHERSDVQKGRPKSHIEEVFQHALSVSMCNLERPFCTSGQEGFQGYRTECVSAPIIHRLYSVGIWNSLQMIPDPYSAGAPSLRSCFLEADAKSPSTWSSVGMMRRISAGGSGDSVCM